LCRFIGGIFVFFNVLLITQIFAIIFAPQFLLLGVIESVRFRAIMCRLIICRPIMCRLVVLKFRPCSLRECQYIPDPFENVRFREGKGNALLRLRDTRPPSIFSASSFILVINAS
jgi:hypothetical protein